MPVMLRVKWARITFCANIARHNAVVDVVDRQVRAGVDVVNDGEMGKPGFIRLGS